MTSSAFFLHLLTNQVTVLWASQKTKHGGQGVKEILLMSKYIQIYNFMLASIAPPPKKGYFWDTHWYIPYNYGFIQSSHTNNSNFLDLFNLQMYSEDNHLITRVKNYLS